MKLNQILITIILAAQTSGYFYIDKIVTENKRLTEDLKQEIKEHKETVLKHDSEIASLKTDYNDIIKKRDEMQITITSLTNDYISLNDKLNNKKNGEQRDMNKLLTKKPGLMQNIINDGTKEVMDCFRNFEDCK